MSAESAFESIRVIKEAIKCGVVARKYFTDIQDKSQGT